MRPLASSTSYSLMSKSPAASNAPAYRSTGMASTSDRPSALGTCSSSLRRLGHQPPARAEDRRDDRDGERPDTRQHCSSVRVFPADVLAKLAVHTIHRVVYQLDLVCQAPVLAPHHGLHRRLVGGSLNDLPLDIRHPGIGLIDASLKAPHVGVDLVHRFLNV